MCVCAHKRRRIFGHTRHILEAGGRDREQIKNRSPLHQSVGLETRGGKLVDEELGEGGGGYIGGEGGRAGRQKMGPNRARAPATVWIGLRLSSAPPQLLTRGWGSKIHLGCGGGCQ